MYILTCFAVRTGAGVWLRNGQPVERSAGVLFSKITAPSIQIGDLNAVPVSRLIFRNSVVLEQLQLQRL